VNHRQLPVDPVQSKLRLLSSRIEVRFLTCLWLLILFHAEAFFADSAAISPSNRT
jgi:hypothetical protein